MRKILSSHLWVACVFLMLKGYANASSFDEQNYENDVNNFGVFVGGYGRWAAYITSNAGKTADSVCRLVHYRNANGKVVTAFEYGNEQDFIIQTERASGNYLADQNFEKTKELLKQLCILKNADYSVKHANPDFVLCARDVSNAKIVLWDFAAVRKEGFFSVENGVVDGMVFIEGNGYRPHYFYAESGWKGERYLDMYNLDSQEIYTHILIGYAKNMLWYGSAEQCNRLIERSACRGNYHVKGYDRRLFNKILNAADGLWSRQFCISR